VTSKTARLAHVMDLAAATKQAATTHLALPETVLEIAKVWIVVASNVLKDSARIFQIMRTAALEALVKMEIVCQPTHAMHAIHVITTEIAFHMKTCIFSLATASRNSRETFVKPLHVVA